MIKNLLCVYRHGNEDEHVHKDIYKCDAATQIRPTLQENDFFKNDIHISKEIGGGRDMVAI